jgi:5-formyltetrahydrofolate cyclo-ligase
MTKEELRKIYKQKRKQLSLHEREKLADLILINFQKADIPFINCVHTYLASERLGEVNTANIIRYLQFKNPDLKIAVPKINADSENLDHYHFSEETKMSANLLGIDEPEDGIRISETEIDLALIPLLAFDKKGYRVGYGKGHYDRFLAKCRPGLIKAGISFFDAVDEIEDTTVYDIPLDLCITPHQLYIFDK